MNTITTAFGIVWDIHNHNGKACFQHSLLGIEITFHPSVGEYGAWYKGREVMSDKSAGVCLEVMTEAILDHYSNQIIPMWDDMEHNASLVAEQAAE